MKSTRKYVTVGLVLALTLLLAGGSVLYARMGSGMGGGFFNHEERAEFIQYRLTKELGLDSTQQQELQTIVRELMDKGRAHHELREAGRQELLDMLRKNSVDKQRIDSLTAKHREQAGEFMALVGDRLGDFLNVLTPDQKMKLADLIEKHHGCHGPGSE